MHVCTRNSTNLRCKCNCAFMKQSQSIWVKFKGSKAGGVHKLFIISRKFIILLIFKVLKLQLPTNLIFKIIKYPFSLLNC